MHFKYCVVISTFLVHIFAEQSIHIEDIPIEDFVAADLQEHDMDLELLPRIQRTTGEIDPKENFFRFVKSYKDDNVFENVPQPGGFQPYFVREQNIVRNRRDTPEPIQKVPIEKQLGEPLELSVIGLENSTEITVNLTESTTSTVITDSEDASNLLINDFIRFKRDTENKEIENLKETNDSSLHDGNRLKRDQLMKGQSEKIQMDPNNIPDSAREPRGATKEQWVKQVYPVRRSDDMYDDVSPASSESIRAPRVHFVTQRRSEITQPSPNYRSYDREARVRNLNKELSRDLARDLSREMDYYYQPRYTRNYNPTRLPPPPPPPRYRYDNYYRYDSPREYYEREPDHYYVDRDRSLNNVNKQRRIIYYATLPDVSRTPPNVDLRDRYNYRDRYDDRYVNSPTPDPYSFRKNSYPKSRYEENERAKTPYPVKVSTDVSVREIKKNPERRIYSEVDRNRYTFKPTQYQNERN